MKRKKRAARKLVGKKRAVRRIRKRTTGPGKAGRTRTGGKAKAIRKTVKRIGRIRRGRRVRRRIRTGPPGTYGQGFETAYQEGYESGFAQGLQDGKTLTF